MKAITLTNLSSEESCKYDELLPQMLAWCDHNMLDTLVLNGNHHWWANKDFRVDFLTFIKKQRKLFRLELQKLYFSHEDTVNFIKLLLEETNIYKTL